jgi:hypothetical protein
MTIELLALSWVIVAQTAKPSEESSWQAYTSKAGQFTVLMPGKPVEKTQRALDNPGQIAEVTFKTGNSMFIAARTPNASPIPLTFAGVVFDSLKQSTRGKLVGERRFDFNGFPAVDLTLELPGDPVTHLSRIRFVLEGASSYNLMVIAPKDEFPKEAERFFDSLKFESANKPAPAGKVEWKTIAPANAGFSVMMPGAPDQKPDDEEKILGHAPAYHAHAPVGPGYLSVLYADLDEHDLQGGDEQALVRVRDDDTQRAEKVLKCKIVQDRKLTVARHPAREYEFSSDEGPGITVRIRSILVGNRLYQLSGVGTKAEFPAQAATRFFESFQLTDEKPSAPKAKPAR